MESYEFIVFYEEELAKLITELKLYKSEDNIWKKEKNVSNSAGNLTLHLIGNLHSFIGKEIGKTNYIRNRALEFSQENVSRVELINGVVETIEMLKKVLGSISNEDLKKEYPLPKFSEVKTNAYLLIHLLKHLSYHLGQINYHRRLLEE